MSNINLGPFRLNPRGELKPGEKYKFLDLITYEGSSYVNINNDIIDGDASINQLPTEEQGATKYYQLIAARGPKGEAPEQYDKFITITNNDWDYSLADKIKIGGSYDNTIPINILNVYDGCGRQCLRFRSNSFHKTFQVYGCSGNRSFSSYDTCNPWQQ